MILYFNIDFNETAKPVSDSQVVTQYERTQKLY